MAEASSTAEEILAEAKCTADVSEAASTADEVVAEAASTAECPRLR